MLILAAQIISILMDTNSFLKIFSHRYLLSECAHVLMCALRQLVGEDQRTIWKTCSLLTLCAREGWNSGRQVQGEELLTPEHFASPWTTSKYKVYLTKI